ncbi:general stress protein [Rummeliibacillus sp. SL167]|uniref:general stress protein n=1 Tax=Rummeliibacillus sp. SL167 TaxID=2579792 RepID=UPI0011B3F8A6|nr:general stress protein [Rummeliibacillus sp. SL167]
MISNISVENAVQAKNQIEKLESQGLSRDNIYIFAHGDEREEDIADALHAAEVGIKEQGFFRFMKNYVVARGNELRSQMEAVGLSKEEAAQAEKELDQGKLIIIARTLQ